jgi:hypothetical protein
MRRYQSSGKNAMVRRRQRQLFCRQRTDGIENDL